MVIEKIFLVYYFCRKINKKRVENYGCIQEIAFIFFTIKHKIITQLLKYFLLKKGLRKNE